MLDEINLKRDERDDALDEIASAARSCLEDDGTIYEFEAAVGVARISGAMYEMGPYRIAETLRYYSEAVRGLVLEQFPEQTEEEVTLILNATDELEGLGAAKKALEVVLVPDFVHFVHGFPEDFAYVHTALRENCEEKLGYLMDKVRAIGFELAEAEDRWLGYRYNDRTGEFDFIFDVQKTNTVHSGVLAVIEARMYELGSALSNIKLSEV